MSLFKQSCSCSCLSSSCLNPCLNQHQTLSQTLQIDIISSSPTSSSSQIVHVIGYFGHSNIGDEQYKTTLLLLFSQYLPNISLKFTDCDRLLSTDIEENSTIILGGGDVLNDYFLDTLSQKFRGKKNKIIAFSVGVPYTSIITNYINKLSFLDYIFVRTPYDLELLSTKISKDRLFYCPDISCLLSSQFKRDIVPSPMPAQNICRDLKRIKKTIGDKIICVSLNRHIYGGTKYGILIWTFAWLFDTLINQGYYIVFLPYNTSAIIEDECENAENDILIHRDVVKNMQSKTGFTNIEYTLSVYETLGIYDFCKASICMRFHSCLFSLYKKVPFLAIYTTRKIRNFLEDINWEYGIEMNVDYKTDLPINFDIEESLAAISLMLDNTPTLQSKLVQINIELDKKVQQAIPNFIFAMSSNASKRPLSDDPVELAYDLVCKRNGEWNNATNADPDIVPELLDIVLYTLTKDIDGPYRHGLETKMFCPNYNWKSEWSWILNDYKAPVSPATEVTMTTMDIKDDRARAPCFNMHFIEQRDNIGVHRSGWQYVYNHLLPWHSEKCPVLLDMYVDRTFHWKRNRLSKLGIVPYKNPWIGFVHHTFDKSFSNYNNHVLLQTPEFLQSLQMCRGLIVLSNYLRELWLKELPLLLDINIPIHVLTHPTETPLLGFSMDRFIANQNKSIVHIGGWLRNIYSFYNFIFPSKIIFFDESEVIHSDVIKKLSLQGTAMNSYYPDEKLVENIHESLCGLQELPNPDSCTLLVSHGDIVNNWHANFLEHLKNQISSVEVQLNLDDEHYDELLSQNIVFLNLVDASAVNTVLECIVRNTPLIINKHPAIVELLGADYPLYYNHQPLQNNDVNNYFAMNKEIEALLKNPQIIVDTHLFLKNMDKTKFNIEHFIKTFLTILQTGISQ